MGLFLLQVFLTALHFVLEFTINNNVNFLQVILYHKKHLSYSHITAYGDDEHGDSFNALSHD